MLFGASRPDKELRMHCLSWLQFMTLSRQEPLDVSCKCLRYYVMALGGRTCLLLVNIWHCRPGPGPGLSHLVVDYRPPLASGDHSLIIWPFQVVPPVLTSVCGLASLHNCDLASDWSQQAVQNIVPGLTCQTELTVTSESLTSICPGSASLNCAVI